MKIGKIERNVEIPAVSSKARSRRSKTEDGLTFENDSAEYDIHPSARLRDLFRERPYQGNSPESASVLIIGNDANYSPQISDHPFFEKILEYHQDGVAFWKKHGVHHPFLLDTYPFDKRKGGVRYHNNFRKLGLGRKYAEHISFLELLDVPTIGNTGSNKTKFYELLNEGHLNWIESIIFGGSRKFVLVNQTLANEIDIIKEKIKCFRKLTTYVRRGQPVPRIIHDAKNVRIFNGYSFSHSVTNEYLSNLSEEIRKYVEEGGISL